VLYAFKLQQGWICLNLKGAMKSMLFGLVLSFLSGVCLKAAEPLKVSVFSTILNEIAQRVGGDAVKSTGHVPVGADPHEFEPRPSDLKVVSSADVILLSAKHMEGYVGKLREVSGKARVVEVGAQISSVWVTREAHTHGEGGKAEPHKHEKIEDPHWWHSVENMRKAVGVIRDEFSKLRPESKAVFVANAAAYDRELVDLQQWAKRRIAELPRDRRKLVTSHEAFEYFARDFGFKVFYVEGLTASDQPASKKVAELLETIQTQKVKAVFAQDSVNPKVLREITSSTGAKLGGQLWADGLGAGDAATYDGMFRHNVNTLVEALK
jgi:ABC-type Zn uptake system ZnuABC Zn-binding protein ZnuA